MNLCGFSAMTSRTSASAILPGALAVRELAVRHVDDVALDYLESHLSTFFLTMSRGSSPIASARLSRKFILTSRPSLIA